MPRLYIMKLKTRVLLKYKVVGIHSSIIKLKFQRARGFSLVPHLNKEKYNYVLASFKRI